MNERWHILQSFSSGFSDEELPALKFCWQVQSPVLLMEGLVHGWIGQTVVGPVAREADPEDECVPILNHNMVD